MGHTNIYPSAFSLQPNSSLLTEAMDMARGGQFIQHPGSYPQEAWYHYDDYTCDYECMAVEYLYWCIVTDMGILSDNFGRKFVIIPSMIALGFGLLGLYIVGSGILFLVMLAATGAVLFSVMALILAAAGDLVTDEVQATAVSTLYLVVILFTGLSPVFAGFAADEYGVRSTFLIGSGLALAAGIFGMLVKWQKA